MPAGDVLTKLLGAEHLRERVTHAVLAGLGIGSIASVPDDVAALLRLPPAATAELPLVTGLTWHAPFLLRITRSSVLAAVVDAVGERRYEMALACAHAVPGERSACGVRRAPNLHVDLDADPSVWTRAVRSTGTRCIEAWLRTLPDGPMRLARAKFEPGLLAGASERADDCDEARAGVARRVIERSTDPR